MPIKLTENRLRQIIREEASRLAAGPMNPRGAAEAVLAALGTSGAEELVDRMYAATGPAARMVEKSFLEAMVAAGVSPTLARDPAFRSEVYTALTDIVNPWDASARR